MRANAHSILVALSVGENARPGSGSPVLKYPFFSEIWKSLFNDSALLTVLLTESRFSIIPTLDHLNFEGNMPAYSLSAKMSREI